jgi:DnaJ-class molecular chaperone
LVLSAYEILGVPRDADTPAIKNAYRALVRSAHPDKNGSTEEANERFLRVQAAYEVLIDPHRRASHDAQLDADLRKAQLRRRRNRLRRLYQT